MTKKKKKFDRTLKGRSKNNNIIQKKMGSAYIILGKKVLPWQLSAATIGAVVAIAAPKPWGKVAATPAIDASSPEEEKFVKEYLKKNGVEL
ncbi:hypothetical protein DASC09_027780 [Saccharomycopsis crataegensis]|uniref:Uncharacterized protein n=1 Tax=Saccharomycopsis crataegensis TaxID=43959 RepID=A0AAV5QKZ3_9ASCO|nr:hypothetical protein DASC09_027780 [Saccharomycopsis crataegensis]